MKNNMTKNNIMKRANHNRHTGGIAFYVLLAILLVAIGILIYLLIAKTPFKTPKNAERNILPAQTQMVTKIDLNKNTEFSDGLENPKISEKYELDELGEGISEKLVFEQDINNDEQPDRITRLRHENGTAHFFFEYKIELNENGKYIDITPEGFRTTEGAECALQKLKFSFLPDFKVVKISRKWQNSWATPTLATKKIYTMVNNKFRLIEDKPVKVVCDVSLLF